MNIVYQILAKGVRSYASNIEACDAACAIIIANGVIPKVMRMKRNQVPLCDLELINEL